MNNDSKRILTLSDLFGMAVGVVIGTGVMTMTGIAIGYTGRSVNIAYLIAAVLTVISSIPPLFILATARFTGGQYSQISVLAGKKAGGVYAYLNIALTLQSTLTLLSLGQYILTVFTNWNAKLVSLVILTVLILLNATYLKSSAIAQKVMVIILFVALGCYIVQGWPHLVPDYTAAPDFMSGGIVGLLKASVFVSSAVGGATYIADYSDRMKNPVRDMPIVIVGTTLGVGVLYFFVGTVAGGVLPLSEIAGKPLSIGAKAFMGNGMYTFFVVGGAIFALLTTINSSLGSKPYPMRTSCQDGWLPESWGTINEKFNSPHKLYIFIYLLIAVPLLFGIDISVVATSITLVFVSIRLLMAYAAMRLPVVMPELWEKSKFHVSTPLLNGLCGLSLIVNLASLFLTLSGKGLKEILMNLGMLGLTVVLMLIRYKKANITASYEAS